jgi:hypothetical protein
MGTVTGEAAEICAWLDQWWYITSEWLEDPYPLDDTVGQHQKFRSVSKWDAIAHEGMSISDQWNGIDLSPLKDLLFAMLAYGEPSESKRYGSCKTMADIHDISSRAWRAKTQFDHICQKQFRDQPQTVYTEKLPKGFIAEELGDTWETLKKTDRVLVKPDTNPKARNVEVDTACLAGTRIADNAERQRVLNLFRVRRKDKT